MFDGLSDPLGEGVRPKTHTAVSCLESLRDQLVHEDCPWSHTTRIFGPSDFPAMPTLLGSLALPKSLKYVNPWIS